MTNQAVIGVRGGPGHDVDVTTGADDGVQSRPIHHQVPDHGEGLRPQRFYPQLRDAAEGSQVLPARRGIRDRAVRNIVYGDPAGPAHPFPAVGLERDGFHALFGQLVVQSVQ